MSEKYSKLLFRDALLSTVFVFVCIAVFALNPFHFHLFNIIGDSFKDIEITDIVFSGKNKQQGEVESRISNEIVLINAADRGRGEIATLINKINSEEPAVLGIDFLFEGPKNEVDDSLLAQALSNTKKLVLASKFKNSDGDNSGYCSLWSGLGKHQEGFANLLVTDMNQTVRQFSSYEKNGSETVYPFALEVVRQYDSSKFNYFIERGSRKDLINYEGNLNSIHHFNGHDIETNNFPKGFLKNKVVILGFFGSDINPNPILDDYFYTPLNEKLVGQKVPDTYGIVIQANIVNMMLNGSYINKAPVWLEWLIGFLICFLLNFIFIKHYVHKHLWYHFYAKMIQLVISIALLFVFIYLFKTFNIKLSASPFLVPILLNVDLLYFYDTLLKWLNKKYKVKTYFLTGPAHH